MQRSLVFGLILATGCLLLAFLSLANTPPRGVVAAPGQVTPKPMARPATPPWPGETRQVPPTVGGVSSVRRAIISGGCNEHAFSDVPKRKDDLVSGRYELPAPDGPTTIAVKIIDMLGEEVLATAEI